MFVNKLEIFNMFTSYIYLLFIKLPVKFTCLPLFCYSVPSLLSTNMVAKTVKNLPANRMTCVWSLGWEDPLKEDMATNFSILAWRVPMDRGAWQAIIHGVIMSELLSTHKHIWNIIILCHVLKWSPQVLLLLSFLLNIRIFQHCKNIGKGASLIAQG